LRWDKNNKRSWKKS